MLGQKGLKFVYLRQQIIHRLVISNKRVWIIWLGVYRFICNFISKLFMFGLIVFYLIMERFLNYFGIRLYGLFGQFMGLMYFVIKIIVKSKGFWVVIYWILLCINWVCSLVMKIMNRIKISFLHHLIIFLYNKMFLVFLNHLVIINRFHLLWKFINVELQCLMRNIWLHRNVF